MFKFKNILITTRLYKAFVRPLVEFSSIVWSPYTSLYIEKIEKVQQRMCRMVPELRGLGYRTQLQSLGLLSLKTRRIRYQLIMIFKMYKGFVNINFSAFFGLKKDKRTRGHSCQLALRYARVISD